MDAKNLHQLALSTSRSLTEALQFNRGVLEALQSLASHAGASPTPAAAVNHSPENPRQGAAASVQADTNSWRLQTSPLTDFASLTSSAAMSPKQRQPQLQPRPPPKPSAATGRTYAAAEVPPQTLSSPSEEVDNASWLIAAGRSHRQEALLNGCNSASAATPERPAEAGGGGGGSSGAPVKSGRLQKLRRSLPGWLGSGDAAAAAAARSSPAEAGQKSRDDLQVHIQSAWEKAQNRLLSAIDVGGGGRDARRQLLRRSKSTAAGGGAGHRLKPAQPPPPHQHLQHHKQDQRQAAVSSTLSLSKLAAPPKKPKKKQQPPQATASKRREARHDASKSSSVEAFSASLASSLKPTTTKATTARSGSSSGCGGSSSGRTKAVVKAMTSTASASRHREAACLRAVDCLLRACRQGGSGGPATVSRLARDLLHRLAPYREDAERPFAMSSGHLELVWAATQTVAEPRWASAPGGAAAQQQQVARLVEGLARLQAQLQLHLRPEAALPAMEPAQRLRYFSEYCYLLIEDCNRLAYGGGGGGSGSGAQSAVASRAAVLLSVTRYFVGNQHQLGPSCADPALLMRCYDRLERLLGDCVEGGGGATSSSSSAAATIEQRLRQFSGDLGKDLTALCELLMRDAQQLTDEQQMQQQQRAGGSLTSPAARSSDRRSKSTLQSDLQSLNRRSCPSSSAAAPPPPGDFGDGGLCAAADGVIRQLRRLVESPLDSANADDEAARLGKSVGLLLGLACEQQQQPAGLRVKAAYMETLHQLRSQCEARQLRALPFDFFYSVLTDTLLFRRSLAKQQQQQQQQQQQSGLAASADQASDSDAAAAAATTAAAADQLSTTGQSASQEVPALLGLISSVVCDLYLVAASGSSDVIFTDAFQGDLRRLIALADRRGLAFLDSSRKRQMRHSLLKLTGYMKAPGGSGGGGGGGGGASSGGGGRLPLKSLQTLMRLLLEIRLHLDRGNVASSEQLRQVEKTVQFGALPRYLALRGSRVVHFACWSQDTPQLRQLLNPFGKDPAVLRVERQCRCLVALNEEARPRCRPRSAQLSVDLRTPQLAHQGSHHAACIRLLTAVLKAKRLSLEPCEATVQVTVQL